MAEGHRLKKTAEGRRLEKNVAKFATFVYDGLNSLKNSLHNFKKAFTASKRPPQPQKH